ncbi:MAG: hypothetical protein CL669_05560 [Balneola sp.]|nr:hypothetical protein [Balneola sp.]|tara:strand:+ start:1513 stop:2013 length:501 start_codon:yes stop_codon:yes gene_type:complete
MITSVLLSIIGTIGFTIEDSVDSIPTPNVPNSVFFADEPVQSNPLALLISANADITWDRSDVFLVVADDDKKDQCDGLNFIERSNPNTELCTRNDNDFVAIGDDNVAGFTWSVESGEYYVGIGSLNEISGDFELNVDYQVKLTLSTVGYFVMLLVFFSGFVLNRYQ